MTMPKKPASGQGIVSGILRAASGIDMPTCCDSTIRRNSERTGSCDSVEMRRMPSFSGRPDLMARTMMSSAFGNSSRKAFTRRPRRKDTNQRGTPNMPAAKAPGNARTGAPRTSATTVKTSPDIAE
jgi:hypothetical protein